MDGFLKITLQGCEDIHLSVASRSAKQIQGSFVASLLWMTTVLVELGQR